MEPIILACATEAPTLASTTLSGPMDRDIMETKLGALTTKDETVSRRSKGPINSNRTWLLRRSASRHLNNRQPNTNEFLTNSERCWPVPWTGHKGSWPQQLPSLT